METNDLDALLEAKQRELESLAAQEREILESANPSDDNECTDDTIIKVTNQIKLKLMTTPTTSTKSAKVVEKGVVF
jgi:hypothetical protein